MCGRYDLSDTPAAICARFDVPTVSDFAPSADLRPTDRAPIEQFVPVPPTGIEVSAPSGK